MAQSGHRSAAAAYDKFAINGMILFVSTSLDFSDGRLRMRLTMADQSNRSRVLPK